MYILIVYVFLQYSSQLYLSFYISTSRRRKPYCAEPATHLGRDPRAPVRHLFNFFAQCQQNLEINKQQQYPCFANCLQDHHLCFGPNIHNFLILCSWSKYPVKVSTRKFLLERITYLLPLWWIKAHPPVFSSQGKVPENRFMNFKSNIVGRILQSWWLASHGFAVQDGKLYF